MTFSGLRASALAGAAIWAIAGPGFAADPVLGCFYRDYSTAHLAKHPAQVVDEIVLSLHRVGESDIFGTLWVQTANQGHAGRAGRGGRLFRQFLLCWKESGTLNCAVECDGGSMTVTKATGDSLTFRTDYLLVGGEEGCGGLVDLAELPGQPVSYRLNRTNPAICGVE